jgi:phenylpyruvate tautomerase PptA (4-oxalocrotonate tautomerase family)
MTSVIIQDDGMPMIDITAPAATFADPHALATAAAATVKEVEGVPDIPMFRENTAAFVHELPAAAISDVDGSSDHVRVQVLTNAGALNRDQQLAVVERLTALVLEHAGRPELAERTWVLLTEAVPGGWGLWGHAHTNEELVAEARKRLSA